METTYDAEAYRTKLAADMAAHDVKLATFAKRQAEILPGNKAALFAALAAAGIQTVVIEFDGSGDEGQIESITAFTIDNAETDLPEARIEIREAVFDQPALSVSLQSPHEIIEGMAYDFLGQTHGGWPNNDGAYGEFTFTVADQSITLDFNGRFTDSTNYQHEF